MVIVADWRVVPHLRGAASTQLQLIDAMWECGLLVARSSCFREDLNMNFLCEIALLLKLIQLKDFVLVKQSPLAG